MITKSIASTEAQNNFGRVLDDATHNRTRYIVQRRGTPLAVIMSFDDFATLLRDDVDRRQMYSLVREVRPSYTLGQAITPRPERSRR
ncbi:MAG: type II toxin-antitoxin system Phd/YefM family antitoxin [Chloroflexota bacterium]